LKLDLLNYNSRYEVYKIQNKIGERVAKYAIIGRAFPTLIGNGEFVALRFSNSSEWFQTSSIVKVIYHNNFVEVETLNSIYKLVPWE
jgi:hypothetical protein